MGPFFISVILSRSYCERQVLAFNQPRLSAGMKNNTRKLVSLQAYALGSLRIIYLPRRYSPRDLQDQCD